jgi:plastocyanin
VNWFAILLVAASLGGNAGSAAAPARPCAKHCAAAKAKAKKKPKKTKKKAATKPKPAAHAPSGGPRADSSIGAPVPEATPTPTTAPTAPPSATPGPVTYPARTGVDLDEWAVRSSYRTLSAGRIEFNAINVGEDDHNVAVRGGAHTFGQLDLSPGEDGTLTLTLAAGTYVLYCSLTGHEEAGMRTEVTVK